MDREDLTCARTYAAHAKYRLTDPWLDLGVANSPFAVDMHIDHASLLPHFQDTVDSIRYFADASDPLAVISGYPGVGKSTIVEALCQIRDFPVCKIDASSALTQENLLELILEQCSIDVPEYGLSTSAKLTLFADEVSAETQPRLCIIEDAHLLNTACIQLLLELVSKQLGNSLFKVILVGRETLFERIIKQHSHKMIHVRPLHFIVSALPEHQLTAYLHGCLARARWPGVLPEISADTVKQIYSLSDGIPYRINLAADKVLCNALHATANQRKAPLDFLGKTGNQSHSNTMIQLFLSVAYAVLLCGCFGWYNTVKSQQATTARFVEAPSPAQAKPEPVRQVAHETAPSSVRIAAAGTTPAPVVKGMKNSEFLRYVNAQEQSDVAENFSQALQSSTLTQRTGTTPVKTTAPISPPHTTVASAKPSIQPSPNPSTMPTGTRQPGTQRSGLTVQASAVPVTQSSHPVLAKPRITTSPLAPGYTEDEDKILQESGYTLQIMASGHLSAVKQFQQGSRLGSNMLVYKTQRNNQDWYVLTYGQYATYQDAKAAQATVRSRYYLQHAWVKPLKAVHKEIQQA